MKKLYFLFSLFVLFGNTIFSQNNNGDPCTAQRLCPNQAVNGVGGNNFGVVALCSNLAPRPTLWYTATITGAGEFTFLITPTAATDYDFAVWLNTNCNNVGTTAPVRLSFDAPPPNVTGLTTTEPIGDICEGAGGGNGLLRGINVVPGDVVLIAVNFYTNAGVIPPFNLTVGGANGGGGNAQFNCCPTNPSSNFTLTTNCANGNFSVTATATDLTPGINHWWGLYESSVEGSTSDADTIWSSGNPAQGPSGGTTVTFNGLDPNKNYYIKHGIWLDGCFTWMETRIAVPKIKLDFSIKDVNGNPKDVFCIGEDVYLDGSAVNTYGNPYYIDIWDVTGGGLNWLSAQGVNGWAPGNPSWVNITNLFENDIEQPVVFQPNHVYRVKLAINSPCGWIESTRDFTYICCESSTDASFGLLTNTTSSGDMHVSLMPGNNTGGQIIFEEWCIYDAPNGNSGPYNLISCDQFPVSIILPPGRCYFITHRVRTVCGEACSGQTICNTGCDGGTIGHDCGEFTQPTNLNCYLNHGVNLTWNAVPGAVSYMIFIEPFDPECCPHSTELPFSLAPIHVDTNSYLLNFDYPCFSWRVVAICEDGTKSAPSEKRCFNNETCGAIILDPTGIPISAKVYPNPAKDNVIITVESIDKSAEFTIDIYDLKGIKIKSFGKNKTTNGKFEIDWSVNGLPSGIYNINIKTTKGDQTNKKLVVE